MRVQVAIIGGGPSGLLLSQLLMRAGISTLVLERQSRDYVLARIRAGVLEQGAAALLRRAGVGERMDREGLVHDGTNLSTAHGMFRVNLKARSGQSVLVYGQTEVTQDLYEAQDALGATIVHGVRDVALHDLTSDRPFVTYDKDGRTHRVDLRLRVAGVRRVPRGQPAQHPRQRAQREFERGLVPSAGWACCRAPPPPPTS